MSGKLKDTLEGVREKAQGMRDDIRGSIRGARIKPLLRRRKGEGGPLLGALRGNLDARPKILDRLREKTDELRERRGK